MAGKKKTTTRKSASKSADKGGNEAEKLVGQLFLAGDVDVSRDKPGDKTGAKEARRVAGNKLVDDLDEDLTDDEVDDLTKSGVIRPATLADAQGILAREAAGDARAAGLGTSAKAREITAKYAAERAQVRAKHDAERDAELRDLDTAEAEEIEQANADAAEEAGGGAASPTAT